MDFAVRIPVVSHDVPTSVYPERAGGESVREINRRELVPAEQKAMRARRTEPTRCKIAVDADDVAARVDATFILIHVDNPGEIDRGEVAVPEHEEMAFPVERPEASHDLAARIDRPQIRFDSAGVIDRRELAFAEQKAMVVAVAGRSTYRESAETTDDVAALVDPEHVGPSGARRIKRGEHTVP